MSGVIDWIAPFVDRDGASAQDAALLHVPEWRRADWELLFAHAVPVHVDSGAVLIQKEAAERSLYFILSGLLEVTSVLSSYTIAPIRKIPPGSVVGELAFFDARPRSAKVWAATKTDLYRLDFEAYGRFTNDQPRLACNLIFGLGRLLASRMRQTMTAAGR